MLNSSKGPLLGAFLLAVALRFIPFPEYFSHQGLIYSLIPIPAVILSSIHLVELFFLVKRRWFYIFCFNPVDIFLVSQPGDLFWIFESVILTVVLVYTGHPRLSLVTGIFTVALVFS